jgi:hypothetical protein
MVSRDLIFHNFWFKVTSLLLAVIVWMVVKGGDLPAPTSATQLAPPRTTVFPNHALLIIREATDQRPINIEPTDVEIGVAGPPAEMAALRESDIQAFVDLAEVRPNGKARIRVYLPRGIRLETLNPKEARVEILPAPRP